jgi:hypothetical protein
VRAVLHGEEAGAVTWIEQVNRIGRALELVRAQPHSSRCGTPVDALPGILKCDCWKIEVINLLAPLAGEDLPKSADRR